LESKCFEEKAGSGEKESVVPWGGPWKKLITGRGVYDPLKVQPPVGGFTARGWVYKGDPPGGTANVKRK